MFGLYPLPINWLPGLLNEVENMGLLVFLLVLGRFAHLWKGIKDIYCLVLALGFLELSYLISSTEGKQVSYKDIPSLHYSSRGSRSTGLTSKDLLLLTSGPSDEKKNRKVVKGAKRRLN